MIETLKIWWDKSTGFRHAVTTWLGVQLAVPLVQVGAWAETQGQSPLPNWHTVLVTLGYATVSAIISGLIKWFQNRRAFPSQ